MIKIKDYIYNENYVEAIRYIKGNLYVELNTSVKYDMIKDATFEDIEWDYGNTELEELKLDYSAVVTGYKKLEEENKKLRDAWDDIFKKWESQVNKVGKAIRYIEKCIDSEYKYEQFISTVETQELLKILRGEENGRND